MYHDKRIAEIPAVPIEEVSAEGTGPAARDEPPSLRAQRSNLGPAIAQGWTMAFRDCFASLAMTRTVGVSPLSCRRACLWFRVSQSKLGQREPKMKKMSWIPALELVCIVGVLGVFVFLQLVVIPELKDMLGLFGGRAPFDTRLLFRTHDYLQPPWFSVLFDIAAGGIMFAVSQVWHARMPAWPRVPLRVILIAGLAIVLFVAKIVQDFAPMNDDWMVR